MTQAKRGVVYIVQDNNDASLYKIGETSNLNRRLQNLGQPTVVRACECNDREAAEKLLHKQFKNKRLAMSEWFTLDNADLSKACELLDSIAKKQKRITLTREMILTLHTRHCNGVSTRHLANEVGVSHSTLYKHFKRNNLPTNNRKDKGDDAIDPKIHVYLRPSANKWLGDIAYSLNYIGQERRAGTSRVVREMLDWIRADEARLRQFIADTHRLPV